MGATEEADRVAGGASSMGVDRIGEVGGRASEGQAAGMYGTGFTAKFLAGVGARNRTWEPGIEVDKELMEFVRMVELD